MCSWLSSRTSLKWKNILASRSTHLMKPKPSRMAAITPWRGRNRPQIQSGISSLFKHNMQALGPGDFGQKHNFSPENSIFDFNFDFFGGKTTNDNISSLFF